LDKKDPNLKYLFDICQLTFQRDPLSASNDAPLCRAVFNGTPSCAIVSGGPLFQSPKVISGFNNLTVTDASVKHHGDHPLVAEVLRPFPKVRLVLTITEVCS
jgi:hypothetical protein